MELAEEWAVDEDVVPVLDEDVVLAWDKLLDEGLGAVLG